VGVWGRCEVSARQGVEGRTGPKAGKAHVAEWRRAGAKRVLGDVGRGGGGPSDGSATERQGGNAAM